MKQIFVTCMLLTICTPLVTLSSDSQDHYNAKKQHRPQEQKREAAKKREKPSPQEKRRNRKKDRQKIEDNMRQDLSRYKQQ